MNATRVGNFPEVVHDDVDELLCAPGDVEDLVRAIGRLCEPGKLHALRSGIRPDDAEAGWCDYLRALGALLEPMPAIEARWAGAESLSASLGT